MTTLQTLFTSLRQDLAARSPLPYTEAQQRYSCLKNYSSIQAVLLALRQEDEASWTEREVLSRILLLEYRRHPGGFWSTALCLAYYPMLSRLRRRLCCPTLEGAELDHLVLLGFLEMSQKFPLDQLLDRTSLRLRQMTQRHVFELTGKETERCELELPEEFDEPPDPPPRETPEEFVAKLLELGRGYVGPHYLELILATMYERRSLRAYLEQKNGVVDEREYQRLKRGRTRALRKLQDLHALEQAGALLDQRPKRRRYRTRRKISPPRSLFCSGKALP